MNSNHVSAEALQRFIQSAFVSQGLPEADAGQVAHLMTEADLQGSDGHGVIRLPQYIKRIQAGGINKHPQIRVVQERAAMAVVDGDNGMGHLVVSRAVEVTTRAAAEARGSGTATGRRRSVPALSCHCPPSGPIR